MFLLPTFRHGRHFYPVFMPGPDNAYRPFTPSGPSCVAARTTRRKPTGKLMFDLFLLILGSGLILSMAAYAALCDRI